MNSWFSAHSRHDDVNTGRSVTVLSPRIAISADMRAFEFSLAFSFRVLKLDVAVSSYDASRAERFE